MVQQDSALSGICSLPGHLLADWKADWKVWLTLQSLKNYCATYGQFRRSPNFKIQSMVCTEHICPPHHSQTIIGEGFCICTHVLCVCVCVCVCMKRQEGYAGDF
jgi:hypothetical protein